MKVLFAASECAPFVKTGGLADVVSALPKALAEAGASVRVLLPAYPALRGLAGAGTEVLRVPDPACGELRVSAAEAEGLSLLLLGVPGLFDRPGNPYLGADGRDWADNLRFSAPPGSPATGRAAGGQTFCTPTTGRRGWRRPISGSVRRRRRGP
jgi:starch synthase